MDLIFKQIGGGEIELNPYRVYINDSSWEESYYSTYFDSKTDSQFKVPLHKDKSQVHSNRT